MKNKITDYDIESMLIESGIYFDDKYIDSINEDFNLLNDIVEVISSIIIDNSGLGNEIQNFIDRLQELFPSLPSQLFDKIEDDIRSLITILGYKSLLLLGVLSTKEGRKKIVNNLKKIYHLISDLEVLKNQIKRVSYREANRYISKIEKIQNQLKKFVEEIEKQLKKIEKL